MFCTKCGKELYEGDRFCAFCGAEVRSRSASKNDDIVFNPPFKLEAQKKTEEILKAAEERREEEKKAKRETVAFDWNLEGFPTTRPKRRKMSILTGTAYSKSAAESVRMRYIRRRKNLWSFKSRQSKRSNCLKPGTKQCPWKNLKKNFLQP